MNPQNKYKFVIKDKNITSCYPGTNDLIKLLVNYYENYSSNPEYQNSVSKMTVMSIGKTLNGNIFFGINIEFSELPVQMTIHSEQFLLMNAYINDESCPTELIVTNPPCGHCRQFMKEVSNIENTTIQFFMSGKLVKSTIDELLPLSFKFEARETAGSFFKKHVYEFTPYMCDLISSASDEMIKYALINLEKSYAPYTKNPQSLVVRIDGNLYGSFTVENAAFNQSLSLVQTLIINLVLKGISIKKLKGIFKDIQDAVIIKNKNCAIDSKEFILKLLPVKIKIYTIDRNVLVLEDEKY